MKRSASKAAFCALLAGAALSGALVAAPALTQDRPESLLPDIFDNPPAPTPTPSATPAPLQDFEDEFGPARETAPPPADPLPDVADLPPPPPDPLASERALASMRTVGPLTPERGGYGPRTFAGSNGAFMAVMMRRVDAPIASRWAHIVLRRALLSRVPTPREVRDADWIAARADLLTRMGEADGAKMLLANLPQDRFTPRLYAAAKTTSLAAGDIPALCPLASTARSISKDSIWPLAVAMCAGFEGDDVTAANGFNRLRQNEGVNNFDLLLGERIAGLASGVGRAANIDWSDADRLTPYRFGMAAASGLELPEDLWERAPAPMRGWAFRSGDIPLAMRASAAKSAARAGIVSAAELAALAALQATRVEDGAEPPAYVRNMRTAYAGRTVAERIDAMKEIWTAGAAEGNRMAALIATAPAAARIEPSSDIVEDAPALIESMLAAGRFNQALAWWPILERAEERVLAEGWALLALADQGGVVPLSPGLVRNAYKFQAEADEGLARARISRLISALAAMGRISGRNWSSLYSDFEVATREDIHTEALARAAQSGRRGEVAVLSAIGLQAPWSKVRPEDVSPILSAWSKVGLGAEARMLAVESYMRAG